MYLIIYSIYLLASILLISLLYRKSWQDWLMKVMIIATLPGIGWLFPIFWPKSIIRHNVENLNDYMTRLEEELKVKRNSIYQRVERHEELDIIPLEEALLVSEYKTRRKVMIDVLKQDVVNYLEILQHAVSNEDKETSYYAVSAIMELKRKLQLALQELALNYEKDSSNLQVVRTYAEVLQSYLKSGFLDERTLLKYRYTYRSVLEKLIEIKQDLEWAHKEKVEIEITLKLYDDAKQSALKFLDTFQYCEDSYLCLMKVYYEMKSYQKVQETLNSLKKSPIKLSNRALTMVRFWSKGA
ncbi:tetratricopeptide repeat protein [Ureibacillus manganicus]|uniref:Uncharacterized protein n=1 Tax=Ureibacillus manganicus DSM 26584 TaxID=1384049 RepID=A0A0A3I054_9BACL|nr:hypothetical protein [Ureibacillus manganicus]KGR76880.1 hypothetical protein CD29_16195 [Ureibacillus manganicus DSM 26584]